MCATRSSPAAYPPLRFPKSIPLSPTTMRFTRPFSTLAALASIATPAASAQAQVPKLQTKPIEAYRIKNLQFQTKAPNPAVTAYGYYVGPFTGTVLSDPTRASLNLFCVDVLNHINFGQVWTGVFTRLSSNDFSATRHGIAKVTQYQKAAYLASMYRAPGTRTTQWGGIQTAIWNLLNPGLPNGGTNPAVNSSEAYWLNQADSWYNNGGARSFDFSRWSIVTDSRAAGRVSGVGAQEFITDTVATPEPETWILFGTGALVILGIAISKGAIRL